MQDVMHAALVVVMIGVGFGLVSCAGQPFTEVDEAAQKLWNGPKSWLEDWCSQTPEFRAAYSSILAYRLYPYKLTAECPQRGDQGGDQ